MDLALLGRRALSRRRSEPDPGGGSGARHQHGHDRRRSYATLGRRAARGDRRGRQPGAHREGPLDRHRRARRVPAAGIAARRIHRDVLAPWLRDRPERGPRTSDRLHRSNRRRTQGQSARGNDHRHGRHAVGGRVGTVRNEGIELRTNFTAQLEAELKVSQLEETITVTGATPLVDVQSATQQRTVTREVLDTVPTAKSVLGIAALIPAVVEPPNAQDVGGSKGERSVRITVHGGKTFDSRLLQDGMRYNALTPGVGQPNATTPSTPTSPAPVFTASWKARDAATTSTRSPSTKSWSTSGTMGSAEYSLGGAQVNSIPKSGSQQILGAHSSWPAPAMRLQSDNLDDDLISQGLTSVNSVKKVYDVNAAFGGPVHGRIGCGSSRRPFLGHDDRVANLYRRHEHERLPLHAGPGRAHRAGGETNKGGGVRLTSRPRRRTSSRSRATSSGISRISSRDNSKPEPSRTKRNPGLLPDDIRSSQGTWSRPQSTQRALRRRRDGEQVQLPAASATTCS